MHARYKGLNFDDLACFFLVVICIISLFANVCNWLTTHIQSIEARTSRRSSVTGQNHYKTVSHSVVAVSLCYLAAGLCTLA